MFKFELRQHVKIRSHHGGIVSGEISRRMESAHGIEYQVINNDDGFSGWHAEDAITPLTVLQSFYIAYYAWATAAVLTNEFDPSAGLCGNLYDFMTNLGVDNGDPLEEMHNAFAVAGLCTLLPFNDDDVNPYRTESLNDECHKNPERLAWVEKQIEAIYND
jgi:hypothetical protein